MKQCPVCRTAYTDETLRFCLSDGNPLIATDDEQATLVNRQVGTEETVAIRQPSGRHLRVDIPEPSTQMPPPAFPEAPSPATSPSWGIYKVLVVLLLLGFFVVVIAAAGIFFYIRSNSADRTSTAPANGAISGSPATSPTKDDKEELRDQIANLQKMIEEQKRSDRTPSIPLKTPNQPAMTTTARVNSPGDGFLALRTLPNSEIGERILKIPHGSIISVGACGPVVTPVRRSGRWCQASYNGYTGWVFDAYLIY
jgi:hypothetical protein